MAGAPVRLNYRVFHSIAVRLLLQRSRFVFRAKIMFGGAELWRGFTDATTLSPTGSST